MVLKREGTARLKSNGGIHVTQLRFASKTERRIERGRMRGTTSGSRQDEPFIHKWSCQPMVGPACDSLANVSMEMEVSRRMEFCARARA
jgi:hypothetical protein